MNPRYSIEEQKLYLKILDEGAAWKGHLWLATSGSINLKWVGLSKQAILASASAVNSHLHSTDEDIWIHALPHFHVGGVAIWARSFLSKAKVEDFTALSLKWDATAFYNFVKEKRGTLTALVPAQVHDLIQLGVTCPSSLRAVIVGGGRLPEELREKSLELKWPLLPSYGMTECSSQIATAELGHNPALKILPHISVKIGMKGELCFKSPSLLSVYAYCEKERLRFLDPKVDGWLSSEDRGIIDNGYLTVFGRLDQIIKVGGENVDLVRLEAILECISLKYQIQQHVALIPVPDERLDKVIHLAVEASAWEKADSIREEFNRQVLPFERIRQVHQIPYIPRSALSKVLRNEVLQLISSSRTC